MGNTEKSSTMKNVQAYEFKEEKTWNSMNASPAAVRFLHLDTGMISISKHVAKLIKQITEKIMHSVHTKLMLFAHSPHSKSAAI